jgi:hypothetical protein
MLMMQGLPIHTKIQHIYKDMKMCPFRALKTPEIVLRMYETKQPPEQTHKILCMFTILSLASTVHVIREQLLLQERT